MRKVNLFEELLKERNKEISSDELKSIIKNIWANDDSKKDQIKISLNKKNNDKFNLLKFDEMESKNIEIKGIMSEWVGKSPAQIGQEIHPGLSDGKEICPHIRTRRVKRS